MLMRAENGMPFHRPHRGGWEPLAFKSIAGIGSSNNIDIDQDDIDWGYWDEVEIVLRSIRIDVDAQELLGRIKSSAAWILTNYGHITQHITALTSTTTTSVAGVSFPLTGGRTGTDAVGNGAGEFVSGVIRIIKPYDTTVAKAIEYRIHWLDTLTRPAQAIGTGIWIGGVTAVQGFRIYASGSNNINNGEVSVFGRRGFNIA